MIEELRNNIRLWNKAYRTGKPIVSDSKFDLAIEELESLSPDDELLYEIGHKISGDRKMKLSVPMASMEKLKTIEELIKYRKSKNISDDEIFIATPKYDGISLCVNENGGDKTTRGDGEFGQKSNEHYKLINNHFKQQLDITTIGEAIISNPNFEKFLSEDFSNPRNTVAGLFNSDNPTENLKYVDFIRYGVFGTNFTTKKETLDFLNKNQEIQVPYKLFKASEITEEELISLYKEWNVEYAIDGIILEINNLRLHKELGRERNNNPAWARAFKHISFSKGAETTVIDLVYNISKDGNCIPTVYIEPITIDGVTISKVTGNNARYIKEMGIGIGARVVVLRSGDVIPIIAEVLEEKEFVLPNIPNIEWDENGVHLRTTVKTDDQKIKEIISFFEKLNTDNVAEGTVQMLWDAGFTSIKSILEAEQSDFEQVDRFGKRKAEIVFNSIRKATKEVTLSKLQHASNIFDNLGSKKLLLLEHFDTKPSIDEVMEIEGFAEISATEYVNKYDEFFEFAKDLPINIIKTKKVEVSEDSEFAGKTFLFTGFRNKDLEQKIVSLGGEMKSSISKSVNYLVCKDKNSSSSKMIKARDLGIEILEIEEFEQMLN